MSGLFVKDEEITYIGEKEEENKENQDEYQNLEENEGGLFGPENVEDEDGDENDSTAEDRTETPERKEKKTEEETEEEEVRCLMPLRFQKEIVEDMLSRDGLLVLGRGLDWENIAANVLHALNRPAVNLKNSRASNEKKSLQIVVGAREEEIAKLDENLSELLWLEQEKYGDTKGDLETPSLTSIGGEATTVDKRIKIYEKGGVVSVTPRIFVVDLLTKVVPSYLTGILILHAENVKETSNESFIVNLYREMNDWGYVKAISDDPESFTGFTPLATKLKVLRLNNVFLWPRFHVGVSSSLNYASGNIHPERRKEIEKRRFVTEVSVRLSPRMMKIQTAIFSCIHACIQELKRHNPSLISEYWDIENVHDTNFVQRIRLSLESQWHRVSWTSKQLIYDLHTLKDFLTHLLNRDSLTFYHHVQEVIDVNVKSAGAGTMSTTSMSPWLNLDEATTIISYTRERALGRMSVTKASSNLPESNSSKESKENERENRVEDQYILEELPKWDQLALLLDDIIYEKTKNPANEGPILIMCSDHKVAEQLSRILPHMKEVKNNQGKRKFSCRSYMVERLNGYLDWKAVSSLTRKLLMEADTNNEKENAEKSPDNGEIEQLDISKTFSRGKGIPASKRRRTRGAASVANVSRLYSGNIQERSYEPVELDKNLMQNMVDVDDVHTDLIDEGGEPNGESNGEDDAREISAEEFYQRKVDQEDILFEPIDSGNQIVIEGYNSVNSPSILQELSPSYIIMYEPNLAFIRRIETFQAINKTAPAKAFFMYYADSAEEQKHLADIRKEKDAFTRLIREKATLARHFELQEENQKFNIQRNRVINTRIAGGANFRTEHDELKIIVDVREFRSSLPNLIYRLGMKVIPCMLTVGDYILSPSFCVERKSIPDLISSFKTGRLYAQCEQMFRNYELPILLIEFEESKSFSFEAFSDNKARTSSTNPVAKRLGQQDIQTKLITLLVAFPKLKILWSSSPYETAQIFLDLKASQEEPEITSAISKGVDFSTKVENDDPPLYNDSVLDILQNIPGINNINYISIAQNVRNLKELVMLSEEQLVDLLGIENGKKAYNFINQKVK